MYERILYDTYTKLNKGLEYIHDVWGHGCPLGMDPITPEELEYDRRSSHYIGCEDRGCSIHYLKEDGTTDTCRYRINNSGDKFRWKAGSKAKNKLYGAEHLAEFDPKNIIVVEGESDTLTLVYNGFQAVGLPGRRVVRRRIAL